MKLFDHYNQQDLPEGSQTLGTSPGLIPLAYGPEPPPEPVSFTFKDPYYDGTARTLGVAETPSVYGAEGTGPASPPVDRDRRQPREGLTHASFFSGVGGLDLGLERAGWRTVSVSEIDPYARAVLAIRFPDAPQLGSIVDLAARYGAGAGVRPDDESRPGAELGDEPAPEAGVDDRPRLGSGGPSGQAAERYLGADAAGSLDGPGGGGPADDRPKGADDRPGPGAELPPARGLADGPDDGAPGRPGDGGETDGQPGDVRGEHEGGPGGDRGDWRDAVLWSGGFPCQDLSVAGKRRGMGVDARYDPDARTRSGLAFAFLDLAERHRPRFILLENVPGLLSSNAGRDMGAILGLLVELGYGVAFRVLDARHFGVPQRRRRVFILADSTGGRAGAERAAEVLSVGSRCRRHPPAGVEAGEGAPAGADGGAELTGRDVVGALSTGDSSTSDQAVRSGRITGAGPGDDAVGTLTTSEYKNQQEAHQGHIVPVAGALTRRYGKGADRTATDALVVAPEVGALRASGAGYPVSADDEGRLVAGPPADAGRVRAPDGLAGRVDYRPRMGEVAPPLTQGTGRHGGQSGLDESILEVVAALDTKQGGPDDNEAQSGHLVAYRKSTRAASPEHDETWVQDEAANNGFDVGDARATELVAGGDLAEEDDLLPLGLDGHRYRCCGNGVVADVPEWIGARLAALLEEEAR